MQDLHEPDAAASPDPREWTKRLAEFRTPRLSRSSWELASTLIPFMAVFAAMLFAVDVGYYVALLLTPLAGLLLLRLFIIQHDCGHEAFLKNRHGNKWVGRAIGVLTLTPYDCWQRSHALHHASTGNLDARGFGDVDTLTVNEYMSRGRIQRLFYRLYRHPIVLLGFGPAYLFLLRHRLPIGLMKAGAIYWISALATNAVSATILIVLALLFGAGTVAIVFLPVLLIAASTGVWLFYVQHQFDEAQWDYREEWSFHKYAMLGSSYLDLPPMLSWFTGNIGVHHVHHLMSRIPFYRLPDVLEAYPELREMNRITPRQTPRLFLLALYDEKRRRLVSFREAKRAMA
ncbi:fatty acid desaturase [Altererythrobacter lutimaris]|uniref:Fatty acid desaturase n=1 Tax=Altererythrobacter lutimaris TaxID=2743979 RepID=A0A850HFI3_9SPHN|nr:fatty acid desaturase [Altererythrobacter lutimaris]NVE95808.1 fatty acid desaturase [Altererythrobacter lutimaris]